MGPVFNRLGNVDNKYQNIDLYRRALCVCSAGMLRSPTTAWVLSQEPFNYNTRAAGISGEYALVHADVVLVEWADLVVAMEEQHLEYLQKNYTIQMAKKPAIVLDIPDNFSYRDPRLVELIKSKFTSAMK